MRSLRDLTRAQIELGSNQARKIMIRSTSSFSNTKGSMVVKYWTWLGLDKEIRRSRNERDNFKMLVVVANFV